jgi:hypothetical protein
VLSCQSRQYRQTQSSALTINADLNDAHVPMDEKNILNDVLVSVYPANIGTSAEQMYAAPQELTVPYGMPVTLQCNFTDPGSGSGSIASVRVSPGTGVTPVAGTDFKASFTSGNEAAQDANGSLGVSVTWYASYAIVTLTNNDASERPIYVLPFNLRGTIIRLYNKIDVRVPDTTVNWQKYGVRPLNYSMYYQPNQNVGSDAANHWFGMWHLPVSVSEYHEYYANRNATMAAGMIALDIGNRYTAVESVTGIGQDFNIMGIDLTITPATSVTGPVVKVRYFPEPTNLTPMFILDDATYGVLDSAVAQLGF